MAEWRLGYRPGLDQLRAVAVLGVLWSHSVRSGPLRWAGGSVGVAVFFTLSGFLITRLMLEERERTGGLNLVGFYGRRARRLLPPLPFALALCLVVTLILGDEWRQPLTAALTYTINYSDSYRSAFGHLWSLAIEEHFYFVWPLVVAVLPRRHLLPLAITVGAISAGLRVIADDPGLGNTATHLRLDGLLLGAAGALLVEHGWRPTRVAVWGAWAVLALMCLPDSVPLMTTWGASAVAVASLVLVFAMLDASERPRLQRVGVISYGVYLYHFPISLLLRDAPVNDYVALVLVVAASIPLAEMSYRLIEAPAKGWLKASRSMTAPKSSDRCVPAWSAPTP